MKPLTADPVLRTAVLLVLLGAACGPALAASSCQVPSELWDRPRSGRLLLGEQALKPCLEKAAQDPAARLLIRHGNRGEAPLHAEELKGWLAALAIDPSRVLLVNDLGANEQMVIELAGGK
ncbi:MAG TPA: hypothetical protein VF104_09640 [Burkholderiales bacterium]